jgi:hypothetical protein
LLYTYISKFGSTLFLESVGESVKWGWTWNTFVVVATSRLFYQAPSKLPCAAESLSGVGRGSEGAIKNLCPGCSFHKLQQKQERNILCQRKQTSMPQSSSWKHYA